jgi:ribosomal protein S27AE
MTAKERVASFLAAHRPRSFCDECLARALGIDPSTAYRAAEKWGRAGTFIREYGVCAECGESRLITRSH